MKTASEEMVHGESSSYSYSHFAAGVIMVGEAMAVAQQLEKRLAMDST